MTESSKNSPEFNLREDEISLIDLLVVLLRRRRLILGLTLAAAIIGIVFSYTRYKDNYNVEEQSKVYIDCSIPMSVSSYISSPQTIVISILNDPDFLSEVIEVSEIQKLSEIGIELEKYEDEDEDEDMLSILRWRIVNNISMNGIVLGEEDRLYRIIDKGNGKYTIWIKTEDREKTKQFLRNLVKYASVHISDSFSSLAATEVRTFESFLELDYEKDLLEAELISAFYKYSAAKDFLSKEEVSLTIEKEYYHNISIASRGDAHKEQRGKVILSVFAVFILSVFLAFILQAVENVKKDPVASEKIKKALGKSKQKK